MALSDLGFEPVQERVYNALLDRPDLTFADLAAAAGGDGPAVAVAVERLVALGAARPESSRPCGVALVNPAVAIAGLIERLESDLLRRHRGVVETRGELIELAARFQHSPGRSGTADVEHHSGADAIGEVLAELSFFTRDSVLTVHRGGRHGMGPDSAWSSLHQRALRRGALLRILCHRELLADERQVTRARELGASGAQYRITTLVPDPVVVIDQRVAVVPADPQDIDQGILVIRQPALLNGVVRLFERMWVDGEQAAWDSRGEPEPTDADRRVLALLAEGHTDEAIARTVGCSARTLRRRIAVLMTWLAAASRFEAGAAAVRKGWL
ncbi:hypothetical protein [Actinophytocola sp. NPDC049390]|uniref:hypothetical protein n=1 Tax=Actinophytocola sp. NPDC049390 TaxID=3363894 RepID=UPI0037A3F6D9